MTELISKEQAAECVQPGQTVVETVDRIRALRGVTREKLLAGRFHNMRQASEYMRGWNDALEAVADHIAPDDKKE